MALKDKAGNEIPLDGVDAKVYGLIERALEGATAGLGALVTTAVAESVKGALDETLKGVNEKIAAVEAKVAAAPTKGKEGDGPPKAPEGESDLAKALKSLTEQVTKLTQERESETKRTAAERLADEFIGKKLPNLSADAKGVLRRRIVAAQAADEAAAAKLVDEWKAELKAAGVDTSAPQFSADPKKEGAAGGGGEDEEAKRAKIEKIKSRGALVT